MEVRFTFLVFKRIHLNLNAHVKRITAHGANTVNKQLMKYCGNNNKRKHRALHTDIVYKSCRWVKENTRVFRSILFSKSTHVQQNEQAAESVQGTEIYTHDDATRTRARSAKVNASLLPPPPPPPSRSSTSQKQDAGLGLCRDAPQPRREARARHNYESACMQAERLHLLSGSS